MEREESINPRQALADAATVPLHEAIFFHAASAARTQGAQPLATYFRAIDLSTTIAQASAGKRPTRLDGDTLPKRMIEAIERLNTCPIVVASFHQVRRHYPHARAEIPRETLALAATL